MLQSNERFHQGGTFVPYIPSQPKLCPVSRPNAELGLWQLHRFSFERCWNPCNRKGCLSLLQMGAYCCIVIRCDTVASNKGIPALADVGGPCLRPANAPQHSPSLLMDEICFAVDRCFAPSMGVSSLPGGACVDFAHPLALWLLLVFRVCVCVCAAARCVGNHVGGTFAHDTGGQCNSLQFPCENLGEPCSNPSLGSLAILGFVRRPPSFLD